MKGSLFLSRVKPFAHRQQYCMLIQVASDCEREIAIHAYRLISNSSVFERYAACSNGPPRHVTDIGLNGHLGMDPLLPTYPQNQLVNGTFDYRHRPRHLLQRLLRC